MQYDLEIARTGRALQCQPHPALRLHEPEVSVGFAVFKVPERLESNARAALFDEVPCRRDPVKEVVDLADHHFTGLGCSQLAQDSVNISGLGIHLQAKVHRARQLEILGRNDVGHLAETDASAGQPADPGRIGGEEKAKPAPGLAAIDLAPEGSVDSAAIECHRNIGVRSLVPVASESP